MQRQGRYQVFRKVLKGARYAPRVLITDKLRSCGPAHHRLLPGVEHRQSKHLNNRAENSHQPTRQRERAMNGFTSPGHAQRFCSVFSSISPHCRPHRHRLSAQAYRRDDQPVHRLETDHRNRPGRGLTTSSTSTPGSRPLADSPSSDNLTAPT